jgi:hypothetical protein
MAKNAKYYAKISGTWQQQYLQTTAAQTTYTDPATGFFNGKTTVEGALDKIQSAYGTANGLATLDGNAQLTVSQLPVAVMGGLQFQGTIDLSTTKTVDQILDAINVNRANIDIGDYLQVSATGDISQGTTYTGGVNAPGDEGDYDISDNITLEAGDWIIVSAINTGSQTVSFGIVNNTYRNATTSTTGMVTLSDETAFSGLSGNDVVTEGVLGTVMITNFAGNTGDFGTANTFARSNHTHDATYAKLGGSTFTGNVNFGTGADLTMGDGNNTQSTLTINAIDDDAALGSNSNAIAFKHIASGGSLETTSLYANTTGNLQYGANYILHNNNWKSYVNEIFVSTAAPGGSDGKNGDVWIEYVA